jgi:Vitamin B12 dependent methionine synthase, activation domain
MITATDRVVLDPLPFQLEFTSLQQALHIRPGSEAEQDLRRLVDIAESIARPKAIYKLAFIDTKEDQAVVLDGIRFTSRVLRVNLDTAQRVFAYVATSGLELEAWADAQEDFLARFWADSINQAVLGAALKSFREFLTAQFAVSQLSAMNPGSLADWPLREQRPLFSLLGDVQAAIGVSLTPSLLMTPTKSVSGILFPSEETFASCQLCPREACPNRRAAYDPMLFEKRYQGAH